MLIVQHGRRVYREHRDKREFRSQKTEVRSQSVRTPKENPEVRRREENFSHEKAQKLTTDYTD